MHCIFVYKQDAWLVQADFDGCASVLQGSGRRILFHGLSVRMGIVTGVTTFAMVSCPCLNFKMDAIQSKRGSFPQHRLYWMGLKGGRCDMQERTASPGVGRPMLKCCVRVCVFWA